MFCFGFGVCFGGVVFCLFDFLRIVNNSWQQKISGLVCHSSQVLKQSSGALKKRAQKVPSLGKRREGKKEQQPPLRLYIFAKVQHSEEASLLGLRLPIGNL